MLGDGVAAYMNRLAQLICAFSLSLYSVSGFAASLQVAPISVSFSAQEKAKEIWLTNTSDKAIRAQTRVLIWSQVDAQDQLNPTRDLVASPSITEIKAGEKQLVRIIRLAVPNTETEQSYRLLIDELPRSDSDSPQTGLQLLLQYSIPVFLQNTENNNRRNGLSSLDNVTFQFKNNQLMVHNQSKRRIRLSELIYINPNGEKIELINGLVGYVLVNQRMQWAIIKSKQMLPNGKFEARINNDGLAQTLVIQ